MFPKSAITAQLPLPPVTVTSEALPQADKRLIAPHLTAVVTQACGD